MTTIVKHRRTGNAYILLGINGEANKANPSRFISELFNQEKSEVSCSATVCDVQGNIFLAYIDDLVVIEIDGIKPAEILPAATDEAVNDLRSPKDNDYEEEFAEEFADDDELDPEPEATTPISAIDSLDAPNQVVNDDEDWI